MSDSTVEHPEDFSPYLDGETKDRRYGEIRRHLESCPECRREIEIWHSLDDLFRAPEAQIDVPPYQWTRIEAQLQSRKPGFFGSLDRFLSAHRLAWGTALAALLMVAVTVSGVGYRRYQTQRDLAALSHFSESETRRIHSAENPFRSLVGGISDENPFSRFHTTEDENPFSFRQ
jgi:anti-sigma factor RsiW